MTEGEALAKILKQAHDIMKKDMERVQQETREAIYALDDLVGACKRHGCEKWFPHIIDRAEQLVEFHHKRQAVMRAYIASEELFEQFEKRNNTDD